MGNVRGVEIPIEIRREITRELVEGVGRQSNLGNWLSAWGKPSQELLRQFVGGVCRPAKVFDKFGETILVHFGGLPLEARRYVRKGRQVCANVAQETESQPGVKEEKCEQLGHRLQRHVLGDA